MNIKYPRMRFAELALASVVVLATAPHAYGGPLLKYFREQYAGLGIPARETVKGSPIQKSYPDPYDKVWDAVIVNLVQEAFIVKISKEQGTATYFDVDGLLLGKDYLYIEFPFTVLLERQPQGTTLYVYPMWELFDKELPGEKREDVMNREDIKRALDFKGNEFLEKVTVVLTADKRWPYLNESK